MSFNFKEEKISSNPTSCTISINSDKEYTKLFNHNQTCILMIGNSWCPASSMIWPIFKKHSIDYKPIIFYRVDADKCPKTMLLLNITCLPTFISYREGRLFERIEGIDHVLLQECIDDLFSFKL